MSARTGQEPQQPAAHRAYGQVIYWVSIAATLVCTAGPFLAVAFPGRNQLDPHYQVYAIWQGKTPPQLGEPAGGFPGPHFWLRHIDQADAVVQLGIVIGCASAGIAFLATAAAYLGRKHREPSWALLALLSAAIILCAALGVIQIGE